MGGKLTLAFPCDIHAAMEDCYQPTSDFVGLAASGDVPLSGSQLANTNLKRLIQFTRDGDKSNRDWATMALGTYGPDTSEVLDALTLAAADVDCDVRAEALAALARRDAKLALPLVAIELTRDRCGLGVFEAAGIIAHPSLVDGLKSFDEDCEPHRLDDTIRTAIRACEKNTPVEAWIY